MTFFERHGPRDEGHSDDASMLFALSAESRQFGSVESAVKRDLDYRSELFDDWMRAIADGMAPRIVETVRSGSIRPRPSSMRPTLLRPSAPPPA